MRPNEDPRSSGRVEATAGVGDRAAGPGGAPAEELEGVRSAGVSGSANAKAGAPAGVKGTRTAHAWTGLAAAMLFLVVVLVFILQNLRSVRVHFFWATWTIPLAVDLLLAAVLGGLILFAAGSMRILQLRRAARRNGRP